MPELPEVETVRSQLSAYLPMKVVKTYKSKVLSPGILHTKLSLTGKTIKNITRKGKLLTFHLSSNEHLLSHLGMTGAWIISKDQIKDKHTHLCLEVETSKGMQYLAYDDPRRFGHLYQYSPEQSFEYQKRLGADIASPELTHDYLKAAIQKFPERLIKVHLLDQKYFAGSGNYIANEICARAGVRPDRQNKTLKSREIKKLYEAFDKVLTPAIKSSGVTFQGGYRDTTGEKGFGVANLVVFYQKQCQLCKKADVVKITLAQRGTYYCPNCQK